MTLSVENDRTVQEQRTFEGVEQLRLVNVGNFAEVYVGEGPVQVSWSGSEAAAKRLLLEKSSSALQVGMKSLTFSGLSRVILTQTVTSTNSEDEPRVTRKRTVSLSTGSRGWLVGFLLGFLVVCYLVGPDPYQLGFVVIVSLGTYLLLRWIFGSVTVITQSREHVNVVVMKSHGRTTIITNSAVVQEEDDLRIRIRVPVGMNIVVEGCSVDRIVLGDVRGNLEVRASGNAKVEAGSMLRTQLSLSGNAAVLLKEVADTLSAKLTGSTRCEVEGGSLTKLRVDASGAALFKFDGEARSADLSASGASNVSVQRVIEHKQTHVSGAAMIKIVR